MSKNNRVARVCALTLLTLATTLAAAAPSVYPTGTTIYDPARAWSGYTVLSLLATQAVVVIDMNGKVVKGWDGFNNSAGRGSCPAGSSSRRRARTRLTRRRSSSSSAISPARSSGAVRTRQRHHQQPPGELPRDRRA